LNPLLITGFGTSIKNRNVVFPGKGNIVFDAKQERLDFILFNFGLKNRKYI
jgi:hypothetical protein